MPAVCLYFKVHQPFQLKPFSSLDIDMLHDYENAAADKANINNLAESCYLPANKMMLEMIHEHKGRFKVSYAISGTALELFQLYRPDVIESFRELVKTGCVEMLAETYYHSLSFQYSRYEFKRQVFKHHNLVRKLFGVRPAVFCNTSLACDNELVACIAGAGFRGIVCEGMPHILQNRTINKVYTAPGMESNANPTGLFLRNASLSDDIAVRFDDTSWNEYPLTAGKFASWIHAHPQETEVINLFIDYETFGIHKKKETGIFDFLKALPGLVLKEGVYKFCTPSEVLRTCQPKDVYDVPRTVSDKDTSIRRNNLLKKMYNLENMVLHNGSEHVMETWGRLQSIDHLNETAAGFQSYTNIVTDFEITLIRKSIEKHKKHSSFRSVAASLL